MKRERDPEDERNVKTKLNLDQIDDAIDQAEAEPMQPNESFTSSTATTISYSSTVTTIRDPESENFEESFLNSSESDFGYTPEDEGSESEGTDNELASDDQINRVHAASFGLSVPCFVRNESTSSNSTKGSISTSGFPPKIFNFDELSLPSYPFRTFKISSEGKIEKQYGIGNCKIIDKDIEAEGEPQINSFLNKLSHEAYQDAGADLSNISVCFGLNRMHSLSRRKNDLLHKEVKRCKDSTLEAAVSHMEVGFFWHAQWYNKFGDKVSHEIVIKFYKALKSVSEEKAKNSLKKMNLECYLHIRI
jgi:hypothetical protein